LALATSLSGHNAILDVSILDVSTVGSRSMRNEPPWNFDYETPGEVFIGRGNGGMRGPVSYRRFATSADAIQFAIEQLEPSQLRASVLEVNEERFYARSILQLYTDRRYPLLRQPRDAA
jgi:hypothetical protein